MNNPLSRSTGLILATIVFIQMDCSALDPQERRVASELRQLEERKPFLNGEPRELARGGQMNEAESQAALESAKELALARAVGNDASYVWAFSRQYSARGRDIGFGDTQSTDRDFEASTQSTPPRQSIWSDPTFIKNAKILIEEARVRDALRPRIIGGKETVEFPDCVAIGSAPDQWCCTGTLVASNVVVTAGHCFPCANYIFIGPDVNKPGKVVKVKKAIQHPDYGKRGVHNDLSVLVLAEEVKDVTPRDLAPARIVNAAPTMRAVGYGTTDNNGRIGFGLRRMVDLAVASSDCITSPDPKAPYKCDAGLEIVAGGLDKDACKGDSGGPLYVQDGGTWYLAGATSRGLEGTPHLCGDGGIYVRLERYAKWICEASTAEGAHWRRNPQQH